MIQALLAAIQFLTILPVGKRDFFLPGKMVPLFPMVGLLIGLLLGLFDLLACHLWSLPMVAVLDLVFLVLITGGLHLDGVCDTADGLYGGRGDLQKSLAIMKDSRTGAIGVVTVICLIALKTAGLFSLHHGRTLLLILIPAYSRGATLFGFALLPYGRPEGGTGHDLFERKLKPTDFKWFLIPILLSVLLGLQAVLLNAGFAAALAGILAYYRKKMDCITGDMLGAMTEVMEVFLLVLCSMRF